MCFAEMTALYSGTFHKIGGDGERDGVAEARSSECL